jgi:hypothetical protein
MFSLKKVSRCFTQCGMQARGHVCVLLIGMRHCDQRRSITRRPTRSGATLPSNPPTGPILFAEVFKGYSSGGAPNDLRLTASKKRIGPHSSAADILSKVVGTAKAGAETTS